MAGRRRGEPKPPPAPLVYEESDAVAEIARRLVRLFPTKFGWTSNFRLGYVMVRGGKRKSDRRFDAMAKFKKVPPLYHGLTDLDAVVEVQEWAWRDLNAEQQEALVAHELCHGSMSEKGALRVERHDLEEFVFVVREWGAWDAAVKEFDHQLRMFDERGATVRTPSAEQATLDDRKPASDDVQTSIDQAAARGEPTPIAGRRSSREPTPARAN